MTVRNRRSRLRVRVAVAALGLLLALGALTSTSPTLAAWTDPENGRATLAAGTLLPPTGLTCGGNNKGLTFTWTNATGGAARTGLAYTWAGGATTTLGANVTTAGPILTVLSIGSRFVLRSTNSTWSSTAVTATVTSLSGSAVTCSYGSAP